MADVQARLNSLIMYVTGRIWAPIHLGWTQLAFELHMQILRQTMPDIESLIYAGPNVFGSIFGEPAQYWLKGTASGFQFVLGVNFRQEIGALIRKYL